MKVQNKKELKLSLKHITRHLLYSFLHNTIRLNVLEAENYVKNYPAIESHRTISVSDSLKLHQLYPLCYSLLPEYKEEFDVAFIMYQNFHIGAKYSCPCDYCKKNAFSKIKEKINIPMRRMHQLQSEINNINGLVRTTEYVDKKEFKKVD